MKFAVGFFPVLLLAVFPLATPLPMTNDADLVSLSSTNKESHELPHMVIAPRKLEEEQVEERPGLFDTIVEQLHAAGVQTADKRQLQTLSYKELTRLLALWHLTQRSTYYDASESRAPSAFDDNIEQ
ncbi:uncharacterized protein LOC117793666 isoform X1 [Drosophila innubila]|uniref:uncharacterized protein LOC117793666 isoform X1 n=1 Tax=Drosophila innubila TaxID=198719 RepID=UPI00148DEC5B|nr:uncharacterized protein LOC117793666 isoform X1 [Drosophila innubila]